jgi:pimeloyl-ACP methyl ester carboxylesterase
MARWILRLVLIAVAGFLLIPFIISLPPIGVNAAELADPGGYFLEIDGMSTYLLEAGDQDAPPVMLLHGWGASTFTWRENMSALAEAGYHVIAFDRPPYGLSTKTGAGIPYTLSALADFTAKVMDSLGIEKAVLVGQSQGGGVVGYFAVKYPERVEKIVLVSAALYPSDDLPADKGGFDVQSLAASLLSFRPIEWWTRLGVRIFAKPDLAANLLRSAYYDPAFLTPEIADGYSRQLKVIGWDSALVDQIKIGALSRNADAITADQIAGISVPVLIMWGRDDTWVPLGIGERLKALLPAAMMVIYPEVGHLPQEEVAQSFNHDLIAFLKS